MADGDDIRTAFLRGADGRATLDHASLSPEGSAQVLKFTGWHDNGLPFAFVSAPFSGSPEGRAAQIAQDLIVAHTGVRMSAHSAVLSNLAATLREQLKSVTDRAANASQQVKDGVTDLHAQLDTVDGVVKEIKTGAADIQAALGQTTNGGPALDPLVS